jgi:hypothetical protein
MDDIVSVLFFTGIFILYGYQVGLVSKFADIVVFRDPWFLALEALAFFPSSWHFRFVIRFICFLLQKTLGQGCTLRILLITFSSSSPVGYCLLISC